MRGRVELDTPPFVCKLLGKTRINDFHVDSLIISSNKFGTAHAEIVVEFDNLSHCTSAGIF